MLARRCSPRRRGRLDLRDERASAHDGVHVKHELACPRVQHHRDRWHASEARGGARQDEQRFAGDFEEHSEEQLAICGHHGAKLFGQREHDMKVGRRQDGLTTPLEHLCCSRLWHVGQCRLCSAPSSRGERMKWATKYRALLRYARRVLSETPRKRRTCSIRSQIWPMHASCRRTPGRRAPPSRRVRRRGPARADVAGRGRGCGTTATACGART
jgi:hypothetical protein